VARALDRARVDAIEICHGDGITGATFNYGFGAHDDGEWIAAVAEECKNAVVTVLLLPGIGTVHDLKHAYEGGARSVRIATHCTEADVSKQHIEASRALGMDTVGFLMMAHMAPVEKLVEQARLMESYGAECVYVTDSAGALLPAKYSERVQAFRQAMKPETEVGVHTHHNLTMGVANAVAGIEAGAVRVDASLAGMGAGASCARPVRWRRRAPSGRQMACPGPAGLDGLLRCADERLGDLSIPASHDRTLAWRPDALSSTRKN
jgi:4-hydroxy 2-oxovalerate aldolase